MTKKIAFQGRRGAYSESAARYLFGEDIDVLPMNTFEEIYQAIETGKADGGAIPIENSTAGSIYENYDLLAKWRHPIVGEVQLQIEHPVKIIIDLVHLLVVHVAVIQFQDARPLLERKAKN